MTSISVIIPWGGDDLWRRTVCDWVTARWLFGILPTLGGPTEVVFGAADADPFNRSAARNDGASRAEGDVLIFADADVIVAPPAVQTLVASGKWGFAFDVYYTMTQQWSEAIVQGDPTEDYYELTGEPDGADIIHRHPGKVAAECVAGCVIVPAPLFKETGGYDEHFIGYGGEDNAFAIMLERHGGRPARPTANALHLWHRTDDPEYGFDQPNWPANARRLAEYRTGAR